MVTWLNASAVARILTRSVSIPMPRLNCPLLAGLLRRRPKFCRRLGRQSRQATALSRKPDKATKVPRGYSVFLSGTSASVENSRCRRASGIAKALGISVDGILAQSSATRKQCLRVVHIAISSVARRSRGKDDPRAARRGWGATALGSFDLTVRWGRVPIR